MPFWSTLALFAVSFIATALLAPKPSIENAKPGQLGDFSFPRNDEGAPIAIFWGRVRFRGPNTLFYGNLVATPITEKVKTGLFSSKRVVVGHIYSLTIHMALALLTGSTARVRRIWFGEKVAWTGNVGGGTDGATFNVSAPGLFGGFKEGGGVSGPVTFYPGTFSQTINTHLQGIVPDGTLLPAYRGLIHMVFQSFTVGEQPNVQPISVELESIPNSLGLGGVGLNGDANPAEALFDIFNNQWGRLGLPSGATNSPSFTSAGSTLLAEGHGISLKIESTNDGRDAIQEVLQQIDGLIYEDPFSREINLRLIRDDYVVANLPVFDESNVAEIGDYSVSTWTDTFNQARVIYTDRNANYKDKTAFAQDLSNITFQDGRVRSADFRYPGISNSTLANQVCARELKLTSIPLIKIRLTTNRDGAQLRPGDVFVLNWPDYGITNLVMRVQRFDLGTLDDNRVVIDCIQDRFAVSETIFADPPDSDWVAPQVDPQPVTNRDPMEMPRFLNLQLLAAQGAALGTDPEESYMQHIGQAPNTLHTSFEAQTSDDAGANYTTDNLFTTFTPTGLLNAAVNISTAESFVGSSPFILKSVNDTTVLAQTANDTQRRQGANLLLIGDEIISYGSTTDNGDGTFTLNNLSRGVLDTSPRAHAENDLVWFISSVELENMGENNYLGTENIRSRYLSQTGFGNLNPADALESDTLLQERPRRPYPPVALTLDGTAHPTGLTTAQNPVPVAWLRRDRLATTVIPPSDADQSPEVGTTYRAKWRLDGGATNTVDMGSGTTFNLDFGTTAGQIDLEVVAVFNGRESLFPVTRTFSYTVA